MLVGIVLSACVCGSDYCRAVEESLFLGCCAVSGDEFYGVAVYCLIVCCGVGCRTCNRNDFGRPVCEGVSVLSSCSFCRGVTAVNGGCSVLNLIRLKHCAVLVHKFDCVLVYSFGIGCGVGCLACNRSDFGRPTVKGVGVLSCCGFCRCCTVICGLCSVSNLTGLENCTVFVDEADGILIDGCGVGCGVGYIAGYLGDFSIPGLEGVGVLHISLFRGCFAVVGGHSAVGDILIGFKHCAVFVFPGDGVFVYRLCKGCGVGYITGYLGNFGSPCVKGVAVLCITLLCGGFARVGGHCSVFDRVGSEYRAVFVFPGNRIAVY